MRNEDLPPQLRQPQPAPLPVVEDVPPEIEELPPPAAETHGDEEPSQPYLRQG